MQTPCCPVAKGQSLKGTVCSSAQVQTQLRYRHDLSITYLGKGSPWGAFIAVQWQEGQRIITMVPTDVLLSLSIRLCASICTAGYHVVRKTGCFSSSLDGGLS